MGIPNGKGYMRDIHNILYDVVYSQGKIIDNNRNEYLFSFQ